MRATGNKHAVKGRLPVAAPRKYDPYWRGYQGVMEEMSTKELVLFQGRAAAAVAGCEREWARRAGQEGAPLVWQEGDPPGGVAEIEARWAEEQDNIVGIRRLADFSDLEGHPRPGAGLRADFADEDMPEIIPEPDVLDVIAQEIVDIGRTHGWDNFGKAVEQLKKEGL